jgi:RNA polymerase sigma-54 factor
MSQGLQLSPKLTQSLVLSPQLQHSLVLLQAPMLELKALVERELQQNPVLEEVPAAEVEAQRKEEDGEKSASSDIDPTEPPRDMVFDPATEKPTNGPVDDFQAEFNRLVQMDQEWRDHFSQTNVPTRQSPEDEEKRQWMFDSLTTGTSLQEALLEQVRQSDLSEARLPIAEVIVGNIDDAGYLKATVEELAAASSVPPEEVIEVLKVVHSFDPPGVGARDLRECLLLQMDRAGMKDTLEYRIVADFMDALGKRRIPEIARGLDLTLEEVQDALARIGRLKPRPGTEFAEETEHYVVPEVFVSRVGDEFVVAVNNEEVPRLRISNAYKDLMARSTVDPAALAANFPAEDALAGAALAAIKSGDDPKAVEALKKLGELPNLTAEQTRALHQVLAQVRERQSAVEARNYIRERISAAKFLIKSIGQRQQTILNIAREIVKRQQEFMHRGVAHLRPLTMAQVAEVVGVHETTVSRAVSGKFIDTPQGVFEMKYFFTTGLQTDGGDGVSSKSVKDMISDIFRKEDTKKPLADDEVAKMVKAKGITIARRTVAKYRGELGILPSSLRKVY